MNARNLVLAASFKDGFGADFATEKSLANDTLGLPVEDFDTVIAEIAKSGESSKERNAPSSGILAIGEVANVEHAMHFAPNAAQLTP